MTVGLVLSGGGAKGSFQIGALQRLYEEGLFAPVISGTSVGAINAVKLAEGGTPAAQKQACEELAAIWYSLRTEEHMLRRSPWFAKATGIIGDERIKVLLADAGRLAADADRTGDLFRLGTARLGPELGTALVETPALTARAADVVTRVISLLEEHTADAADVVQEFVGSTSLMTLEPIEARLRGGDLDAAAVAASTVRLRLAMVSLESGAVRYVTESGSVLGSDQTTYSEPPADLPGPCRPVAANLEAAKKERITRYQQELRSNLDDRMSYQNAIRLALFAVREIDTKITNLTGELEACREAHSGPIPLTTDTVRGTMASASIPAAFPPVRIGLEHYVDGGVRENIPFAGARLAGATHHVVVSASPLSPGWHPWTMPEQWALISIGLRGLDLALTEIAASDVPDEAAPLLIAPSFEVHSMLQVERGLIRINADYGYMTAADVISKARKDNPRVDPLTGEHVRFSGQGFRTPTTRPVLDVRQPALWPLTADAITRLRMAAWALEVALDALGNVGRDVPTLHGTLRAVKRLIRHYVYTRSLAGAAGPTEAVTDTWWGGWELHSDFTLPNHPFAALPGGLGATDDSSALEYVRDDAGTTYALAHGRRQEMSHDAVTARGAAAQQAPVLPQAFLSLLPLGEPLTA